MEMEKVEIEEWESYCPECDGRRKIFVSDCYSPGWPMICPLCFGIGKFAWTERAKGDAKKLPRGKIIHNIKKESRGNWSYIDQWDRNNNGKQD